MTLTCPKCNGTVELTASNDATYPETRVEFYECANCNHNFKKVLTP